MKSTLALFLAEFGLGKMTRLVDNFFARTQQTLVSVSFFQIVVSTFSGVAALNAVILVFLGTLYFSAGSSFNLPWLALSICSGTLMAVSLVVSRALFKSSTRAGRSRLEASSTSTTAKLESLIAQWIKSLEESAEQTEVDALKAKISKLEESIELLTSAIEDSDDLGVKANQSTAAPWTESNRSAQ